VTDELTGLRNRRYLVERLDDALRQGDPLALLLVDLDGFKELNDTLGHHAGDAVLRQIGPRLSGAVREHDTLARLGGDEFALVAHLPSADHAAELHDRVQAVCSEPLVLAERTMSVRVSVGMTVVDSFGYASAQALAAADAAMYALKRGRKNRITAE
jgi:diguanylate cyclase (GGDEF)-like protein